MENFKVRALDAIEQKGTAELEQELLEQHQQKLEVNDFDNNDVPPVVEVIEDTPPI